MSTPPLYTANAVACVEQGRTRVFRGAAATSNISKEHALSLARELAQTRARDAASGNLPERGGNYPYPERTLVEPVLEHVHYAPQGGTPVELGRVTRNSYQSSVLNSYQVMFVDVDTMADSSNAPTEEVVSQDAAIEALVKFVEQNPGFSFRVYATRAGLRYLCTNRLFDPRSDESARILAALRADKRYAMLCRVQKCYRARLTPKPWRCWWTPPAPKEEKPKGFFARLFQSALTPRQVFDPEKFATCNYIQTLGASSNQILPEVERILHLHDKVSEASSKKPLA